MVWKVAEDNAAKVLLRQCPHVIEPAQRMYHVWQLLNAVDFFGYVNWAITLLKEKPPERAMCATKLLGI